MQNILKVVRLSFVKCNFNELFICIYIKKMGLLNYKRHVSIGPDIN